MVLACLAVVWFLGLRTKATAEVIKANNSLIFTTVVLIIANSMFIGYLLARAIGLKEAEACGLSLLAGSRQNLIAIAIAAKYVLGYDASAL